MTSFYTTSMLKVYVTYINDIRTGSILTIIFDIASVVYTVYGGLGGLSLLAYWCNAKKVWGIESI